MLVGQQQGFAANTGRRHGFRASMAATDHDDVKMFRVTMANPKVAQARTATWVAGPEGRAILRGAAPPGPQPSHRTAHPESDAEAPEHMLGKNPKPL